MRVFHHALLKYGHEKGEMQKQKFDDVTLRNSMDFIERTQFKKVFINSSGVSHSDGSCVLDKIHSDVSLNIQKKKVFHTVTDNFFQSITHI